jgi:hypothetical protein
MFLRQTWLKYLLRLKYDKFTLKRVWGNEPAIFKFLTADYFRQHLLITTTWYQSLNNNCLPMICKCSLWSIICHNICYQVTNMIQTYHWFLKWHLINIGLLICFARNGLFIASLTFDTILIWEIHSSKNKSMIVYINISNL